MPANRERRARSRRHLAAALRLARRPLLLILDQFEEYFLYRTDDPLIPAERALAALIATPKLDVHVLIAMRDDSLHLLDKLRATVPGILETTIQLGDLNDAGAEDAISGPIRKYNEIYRTDGLPGEG